MLRRERAGASSSIDQFSIDELPRALVSRVLEDSLRRSDLGDGFTEVGLTERIFENPTDERTQEFINGELVY